MAVESYFNPVHDRATPDPFVLKFCGEYWCYSTGFWHDGRCFGVMRSRDLVHWREQAGAMAPLPDGYREYWAPEVNYWNGRFYMYFSCGDGVLMHLRAAVAEAPEGPFLDSGRRLSGEDFAIDAHVFQDEDGSRYLFYATDFLGHTRIGTGTVVDRMLDPFTLAGHPRPVSRARYDWQVYDPHRLEKGGVRWHTVEGPFVLKFKGRYYQMYSGGNWQNTSYGVSYAVTPRIDTLEEWEQLEHDDSRPLVLRTVPGKVIGPGHNSVVRGPDNLQLFCIYHRWANDGSGRLLAIDRLEWVGDRIVVLGPSTTMQPAPIGPTISGLSGWTRAGRDWDLDAGSARCILKDGSAVLPISFESFILEASLRLEDSTGADAVAGVALGDAGGRSLALQLRPATATVVENAAAEYPACAPDGFIGHHLHDLRMEIDGTAGRLLLDGLVRWHGNIRSPATYAEVFASSARVLLSGVSITPGWQDLFMDTDRDPALLGWIERWNGSGAAWETKNHQLVCRAGQRSLLLKDRRFESYEVVVNVKLIDGREGDSFGIMPALTSGGGGPLFTFSMRESAAVLEYRPLPDGNPVLGLDTVPVAQTFRLAERTDLTCFQHLRFWKQHGRIRCMIESRALGEVEAPRQPTSIGLVAAGAAACCDSVRLTALPPDLPPSGPETEESNG